jgi:hypothetical protein
MKPGRNDPCPCGSGKKRKKCCMNREAENRADGAGAEPKAPKKPTTEIPLTKIPLAVWDDIQSARMDDGRLVRIAILDAVDAGGGAAAVWATIGRYYDERARRCPGLKTAGEAVAREMRRKLSAIAPP